MQSRFLMFFAACLIWMGAALAQVNINTASQEELDGLKGIGPSRARAIIEYREQNGPFKSLNDLKNIRGMPDSVVTGLRGKASVGTLATPATAPTIRREAIAPNGTNRPATPAVPPRAVAKPAPAEAPKTPAVARPAMPATSRPVPAADKPALSAPAPARPALPGKAPAEAKPAAPAPAVPMARPASPGPAKPAGPAASETKPAAPARPAVPARPARPAQPAAAN